jgi:putative colanic acid biosynthesis glycosyltransferase
MKKIKEKKPKLSIITIVLNDKIGLSKTIESVKNQDKNLFEFIVIDGKSNDGSLDIIMKNSELIDKYVSEKDRGIYDAFNKGLKLANGNSILFLNAGDYFIGKVIYNETFKYPTLLPVKFDNIFGNISDYRQRDYRLSHPYNLGGIIFENKGILFDESYKIASDYDFYLRHGYKNLKKTQTTGYVLYDNNGISTVQYKLKYEECGQIVYKYFGVLNYLQYLIRTYIKHLIKVILKFTKLI